MALVESVASASFVVKCIQRKMRQVQLPSFLFMYAWFGTFLH